MKKIILIVAMSTILFSCKSDTGLYVCNESKILGVIFEIEVGQRSLTINNSIVGVFTFPIIERLADKIIWENLDGKKDTLLVRENELIYKKLKLIKLE